MATTKTLRPTQYPVRILGERTTFDSLVIGQEVRLRVPAEKALDLGQTPDGSTTTDLRFGWEPRTETRGTVIAYGTSGAIAVDLAEGPAILTEWIVRDGNCGVWYAPAKEGYKFQTNGPVDFTVKDGKWQPITEQGAE
jgi:hypothetical protein